MDPAPETPSKEGDIQMGPKGSDKNTLAAILSYIGPLVVVSYIIGKDDPFAKFHIKQGLVLLVLWVAVWIVSTTFWWFGLWLIWNVVKVAFLIFAVIGIINAAQGKEASLPLIGHLSKYFSF